MLTLKEVRAQPPPNQHSCQDRIILSALNISSLPRHLQDLQHDIYILQSDIICLTETHTSISYAESPLHQYPYIYQSHAGHGMFILSKFPLEVKFELLENINYATWNYANMDIILIYKPPNTPHTLFARTLTMVLNRSDCNNTVILGDFNINIYRKTLPVALLNVLISFKQCIHSPTSDYGSLLDHIYVSRTMSPRATGIWETWYSDHKTVYICI